MKPVTADYIFKVAVSHKRFLYASFAAMLSWMLFLGSPGIYFFPALIFQIILWLSVFDLTKTLGGSPFGTAMTTFIPLLNLATILNVNHAASSFLKKNGVRVSLYGAKINHLLEEISAHKICYNEPMKPTATLNRESFGLCLNLRLTQAEFLNRLFRCKNLSGGLILGTGTDITPPDELIGVCVHLNDQHILLAQGINILVGISNPDAVWSAQLPAILDDLSKFKIREFVLIPEQGISVEHSDSPNDAASAVN